MFPWQPFAEKGGASCSAQSDCKWRRGSAGCFLGSVVGWALRVRQRPGAFFCAGERGGGARMRHGNRVGTRRASEVGEER